MCALFCCLILVKCSEQFELGSDLKTLCYALLYSTEVGSLLMFIAAYVWLEVQHKQMRAVKTLDVLMRRDGIRSHVICIKTDDCRVSVTRGLAFVFRFEGNQCLEGMLCTMSY